MYTALMLLFALLLVCLNGLFVAAEFSFVKVRKTQLELLSLAGDKRAASALFGVTHLDAYLSVCQLGITLSSLGLGWIGEPAVSHMLHPLFSFFFVSSPALVSSLSIAVGFTIITLAHVVFGELVPKSISIQMAEAVALRLARPMRLFYLLCLPLVTIMNGISNAFLRLIGVHSGAEGEISHSPEELRMIIVDSSKQGSLDKEEGRLLDNIFSFYQKNAKDIMIHRTDVIALDVTETRDTALSTAQRSGHTRFPVYEDNRDNIIGFVHIKDMLRSSAGASLSGLVRQPIFAPETMSLDRLLHRMQNKRSQLSVVIDEYGIWQGILTMEDILEAIVGDIQDEFDNEEPDVIALGNEEYSVSGDLSLDELAEHMTIECNDPGIDAYKILAAHFNETLGRIPEEGDSMELCGKRFTVTAMERNRVRRVRVRSLDNAI
jgi:CBS domain containing-hemolysin-like protein